MSNISQPQSFVLAPDIFPQIENVPLVPAAQKAPNLSFLANAEFPDARWNLGGIFLYDRACVAACNFLLNGVPAIRIENFSGSPPCAWTLDWYSARGIIAPAKVVERLRAISKLKPRFVLQLDNPFIPAGTLGDVIGNSFLNLSSEMQEMHVCVASETLAEHVRKAFPRAKLHAGVNKIIAENGRGNADYYLAAAEKYFRVALHPADAADASLLEKLAGTVSPDKFEITVNDTCLRACQVRREHLEALAEIRKSPWDAQFLQKRHALLAKAGCENVQNAPSCDPAKRAAILTHSEAARAYKIGFRNFRIQAETLRSEISYFWELFRWLIADSPELWEKQGLLAAAISSNIADDVPVVKSGIGAFSMRKYD